MCGLKERSHYSLWCLLWIMMHPLILLALHFIVFSNLLGQVDDYLKYLIVGFLPWHFIKISHDMGVSSYVYKLKALRSFSYSHHSFLWGEVLQNTLALAFFWTIAFLFLGFEITLLILFKVFLSLVILIIFTVNSVHTFALYQVFFRSFKHILELVLRALFFTSPVLYNVSVLGKWAWLASLNPLTYLLNPFYSCLGFIDHGYFYSLLGSILITVLIFLIRIVSEKYLFQKIHLHEI